MKYLKKWYILLLLAFVVECFVSSCNSHARYRRMLKHRRSSGVMGYKSHYTRNVHRQMQPIKKNYIIRNSRPNRRIQY